MSDQQQAAGEQQQQSPTAENESVRIEVTNQDAQPASSGQPSRFADTMSRLNRSIRNRPIRYDPISIVFTILVLVGGVLGFALKGSLASLISGIVFAIILAIGTYLEGAKKNPYVLLVAIVALEVMMLYRIIKTGVFLPAGVFAVLAFIMLARHGYLIYLKKQST